jgi:hypothetical protein
MPSFTQYEMALYIGVVTFAYVVALLVHPSIGLSILGIVTVLALGYIGITRGEE